ncbi:hypothetical protein [Pseudodesulfovibrio sp.]|uniref:hypothetical protein n=1 Tax=unclassified Pseudodesulfovibrio TaxID=2661612 RepID=UPI003B003F53
MNREPSIFESGFEPEQAEALLTHLDGLAAAQGMDVPTWYRKHIAEIEVGGRAGDDAIRFQAMYRSPAQSLGDFLAKARESIGGKQSYFDIGELSEPLAQQLGVDGRAVIISDAVHHVDKRHPGQGDGAWSRVAEVLRDHDEVIPGKAGKATYGRSFIVIKRYGEMAQAVIIEANPINPHGRAYVTTNFVDNVKSVEEWVKRQRNGEEVRMSAGGDSGTGPNPEGNSHVATSSGENIQHPTKVRKALELLQRKAKNAIPLTVVDSFDELPEHIRSRAYERGIDGHVPAVFDGNKAYFVADSISSVDHAVALWVHEMGVHHGLRGLVGDSAKFDGMMDDVFNHFGPERLEDIRQAYGLDFSNVAHRREAAEEMLAAIGEKILHEGDLSDLELSTWESIKAWFREFLREHGFEIELSDDELAGIVKDAVRWTMGETERPHSRLRLRKTSPEKYLKQRNTMSQRRQAYLTPYTADAMRGWDVRMSDDGVGYVLKPNGELIGVVNSSGVPGRGTEAVVDAISRGAKQLDCIDGFLTGYYTDFGFREVGRAPWDDAQAPKGWDYDTYGRHDIVFFEYPEHLSRNPADVRRRFESARGKRTPGRRGGSPVRYALDAGPREPSRQGVGDAESSASAGRVRYDSGNVASNGSVEFLPDGRAYIRLSSGADMQQAGESLSRILSQRFNEFPPSERLNWRTERSDIDVPDPFEGAEPERVDEEIYTRDMEDVQALADSGRLTEQELMELEAADRGVDRAATTTTGP